MRGLSKAGRLAKRGFWGPFNSPLPLSLMLVQMSLGPNGATVYCHEYLLDNIDWLHDKISEFGEDDYIVLDCCGQIELYTHLDVMSRLVSSIKNMDCVVCAMFLVDATFVSDPSKFISGSLLR